jgi:hypothetical protein
MAIYSFLQWFYALVTGKKAPNVPATCPVSQAKPKVVEEKNPIEPEQAK